ncbi:MAG TPA: ABC transporter ATP-binding protein, partial [Aquirhabdus sp.]
LSPHKLRLLLLVFLCLVATALTAVQPLVMAPMVQVALQQTNIFSSPGEEAAAVSLSDVNLNNIDHYVNQLLHLEKLQPWNVVLLLSAIFLGIVVLGTIFETAAFYVFTWVRVNSLRNLQEFVFKHLLSLSLDFFNQQRSGGIVSRLQQDIAGSVNNLTNIFKAAATAPVMALIYGIMLVRTNFQLMLVISAIAAAQWTAARLLRNRIRRFVLAEFDLIAMVNAYLNEIFQNIRVVKSFVAERFEQIKLREQFERMIPVHINRALSKHWQEPIITMINGAGNVLILLLSTRELLNGNLTIVGFFLFLYVGRAMIQPISQMGQIYLGFQEMSASAIRVFEILQTKSTVKNGKQPLKGFQHELRFKNVSFSYGHEPVLREMDVEIARGQTVALVGPSGAGKSTFTDLLLRFYDPTNGEIGIDGQDIRDFDVESYRRLFGVVAQENLLFNDTVA